MTLLMITTDNLFSLVTKTLEGELRTIIERDLYPQWDLGYKAPQKLRILAYCRLCILFTEMVNPSLNDDVLLTDFYSRRHSLLC